MICPDCGGRRYRRNTDREYHRNPRKKSIMVTVEGDMLKKKLVGKWITFPKKNQVSMVINPEMGYVQANAKGTAKNVSRAGVSIWHPDFRRTLVRLLLSGDIGESYQIYGRSGIQDPRYTITVGEFLNLQSVPTTYFHGTTLSNAEKIIRKGLKPRKYAKSLGWAGVFAPSNPDYVYLTAEVGIAAEAANSVREDQWTEKASYPDICILSVTIPDIGKLRPDEDCQCATWEESLALIGGVAYDGIIPPEYIERLLIMQGDAPWEWWLY